ncbi:MAG TPA: alpha/beta fold hydrolase [Acetobacteraceae bacterium]|jgi:esterase/lipase superfamily enzyme
MPRVTVYFGTNRQPIAEAGGGRIIDFGAELGPVSGLAVRFGAAEVDVELRTKKASLVQGSLTVADEVLSGSVGFVPKFGSRTIFDALRVGMQEGNRPTLVIVHGFSNSFESAIERAGWILAFYGLDANVFAFTWPSRGSVGPVPLPYVDYVHDRGTAAASGPAMARTMRILHDYVDSLPEDQRCRQPIHLLCHSMGNFALRHGLQALLALPETPLQAGDDQSSIRPMTFVDRTAANPVIVRRTFDQIVLAAADEDDDAFDDLRKFQPLPRLGRAITVYHTQRDWVLSTLSAQTKFNGPRLGADGPDNMGTISDKVSAIDVSDVIDVAQDVESHQYYRVFPAVRDDIVAVLAGQRPAQIANRAAIAEGRWRLAQSKPAARPRRSR